MKPENQLVIFEDKDKRVEVQLKEETMWLDAHKIAYLFDVDRTVIVKHIRNIYKSGELEENSTCAKIAQVAADGKKRKMNLYNLDIIIAVGYRVNSKKATQFRIWATNVLKNYLIKGYAVNEKRITQERLKELENTIKFIKENINTPSLTSKEAKGLIEIIEKYALVWKWIEEYDTGKIETKITRKERKRISYEEASEAIEQLREYLTKKGEVSDIFGVERDRGLFESALNTIYQTFDGEELYQSFERPSPILCKHPSS